MKDQSDHIVRICAVATANGFAMPYRPATNNRGQKPRHKGALPRAANGLPEVEARRLASPHRHAFGRAHADGVLRA